jgi:hypothetical protein
LSKSQIAVTVGSEWEILPREKAAGMYIMQRGTNISFVVNHSEVEV